MDFSNLYLVAVFIVSGLLFHLKSSKIKKRLNKADTQSSSAPTKHRSGFTCSFSADAFITKDTIIELTFIISAFVFAYKVATELF